MKSLNTYIKEGFFSNVGGEISHPTTKEELIDCINNELDRGNPNLNCIDTSKIKDMSLLFHRFCDHPLMSKIDISKWDVKNVKDMSYMFYNCTNFDSDLSKWNVSKVKDMRCIFDGCTNFNSDLSKWDVSKVEVMNCMFSYCIDFNSDLSKWDVSKVQDMGFMFNGTKLEQENKLPDWYNI